MISNTLRAVSLRRVLPSTSFVGCADLATDHVTDHHNQCRPGSLFVAIRGTSHDGARYIPDAIGAGAVAVLVDEPQTGLAIPQCVVPDVRTAYSQLCLALAGRPDRSVDITGVTGTNGKTTVTWLLRSIFEAAGRTCGLVGTVEFHDGKHAQPAPQTTPGPTEFTSLLTSMANNGARNACVEVSSHALDQGRLGGLRLASAIVTNVTQDHFDYHGDLNGYMSAKERIADYCSYSTPLVVNTDDEGCQQLMKRWSRRRVVSFGLQSDAEARGEILESNDVRTVVRFDMFGDRFDCELTLPGRYNVSNSVAAAAVAHLAGIEPATIATGLSQVAWVPGRMQPIQLGQQFRVFVDYAHTPDGLTNVLAALRPTTSGRLCCVFGAGGDRDRAKRSLLGRAAQAADLAIVTSDNPRSENPDNIINDICRGLGEARSHVEVDRAAAIRWAIDQAEPGDCVVIAGRGHETQQQIGSVFVPFDDRTVSAEAIAARFSQTTQRAV